MNETESALSRFSLIEVLGGVDGEELEASDFLAALFFVGLFFSFFIAVLVMVWSSLSQMKSESLLESVNLGFGWTDLSTN